MKDNENVIAMLLDENNDQNVVMVNDEDEEVEFQQLGIIPFNDELYAILRPVAMKGVDDGGAIVFHICLDMEADTEEEAMANGYLEIESDDVIADAVFDEFLALLDSVE